MSNKDKLYLIDSLSPFCIKKHFKSHVNWSKVNFHLLEYEGKIRKKILKTIIRQFEAYIKNISEIGYNAISIDDLAHITMFKFYPVSFRKKIRRYRKLIKEIIQISREKSIEVYINTDVMFFNKFIKKQVKKNFKKMILLLYESCEKLFKKQNDISGIIFRIGESDGIDVRGDFKSAIILKTIGQTKYFLKKLIPLFEKYNKKIIFRTWAVGGGQIGDINWNKKTFLKVFKNIKSNCLILSMKYGEGDFFRFFDVNELFTASDHKKIIEFQTRREYEGFGEFPNFIGWEYERIIEKIKDIKNIEGLSVWCQTGGWSSFKNLTYQKNTSFFNELNTFTTIKLFKSSLSVNSIIKEFLGHYGYKFNIKSFLSFLKNSDFVINNLLYDPCFGRLKLYFNKLRIPPLPHIFWDNVTLTSNVILVYNTFVTEATKSLKLGKTGLNRLKKINILNKKFQIPYNENFYAESFKLFYLIRMIIYDFNKPDFNNKIEILKNEIKKYKKKFKNAYRFYIHLPEIKHFGISRFLLKLFVRNTRKYRFLDRIIFNPLTKMILMLFYNSIKKNMPQFIDKQAMPAKNIF